MVRLRVGLLGFTLNWYRGSRLRCRLWCEVVLCGLDVTTRFTSVVSGRGVSVLALSAAGVVSVPSWWRYGGVAGSASVPGVGVSTLSAVHEPAEDGSCDGGLSLSGVGSVVGVSVPHRVDCCAECSGGELLGGSLSVSGVSSDGAFE